jgi:hypothetical protein
MRHAIVGLAATALILLTLACTSANRASGSDTCELQPRDSVFAVHAPVFRDCAVTTRARLLTTDLRPDFTPPARAGCYAVQYEFVVLPTGYADANTARLVRTNNQQLADAYLALLSRFRFEPARRDGASVAQIVGMGTEVITRVVVAPAGQRPPPSRAGPGC